ncbi:uncharacterized protein KGF55_000331 [Candida pseudojiufengensis]|uniref:uncharacterized protein n=1 Tax=Candida pseudojiufengensis TaxID=497109 RepID=UPI0022244B95|nr:uncharacterized protein KGF55_000331 [Candida pseudojiufengensis]KAI5966922.1 hypothetical protein KGF55_000331 [Candida pseudojiufengensis]
MRFTNILASSLALLSSSVLAVDVACLVDGAPVAVVDLDTGVCPFTIPASLPQPIFEYTSPEDYDVLFYYSLVDLVRYFTDIVEAGNVINIPARFLYGTSGAPLYQVAAQEIPASNSTAGIRKRLMKSTPLVKRDEAEDFAESLKELNGTFVQSSAFEVVDLNDTDISSGAPTGPIETIHSTIIETETVSCSTTTGTSTLSDGSESVWTSSTPILSTVTAIATHVVTITSCHEDKCHLTTVPGTESVGTTTVEGVETVYTTYCPLSSVAPPPSTKAITTTDSHGAHTTYEATASWTTKTFEGVVTSFITYCPLTEEGHEAGATTTKPAGHGETAATESGKPGKTVIASTSVYTSGASTITTVVHKTVAVESGAHHGESVIASTSVYTSGASTITTVVYKTVAAESGAPGAPETHVTHATTGTPAPAPAPAPTSTHGSTVAAQSSGPASAAVSTYAGSASSNGAAYLALALIPLAYFF